MTLASTSPQSILNNPKESVFSKKQPIAGKSTNNVIIQEHPTKVMKSHKSNNPSAVSKDPLFNHIGLDKN